MEATARQLDKWLFSPAPGVLHVEQPDLTPTNHCDAEDALLADVDAYTDWLYGQCIYKTSEQTSFVPRGELALGEHCATLTVPQLVALSLYPNTQAAGAAQWELRSRYIAAHADWLRVKASELSQGDEA